MYVLADLEWVEDPGRRVSFTQISMVRVDENWRSFRRIFRRISPRDSSFQLWKHIAFTGGSIRDFTDAQDSAHAFADIAKWLWPSDTICWWYADSREWIQKVVPTISNRQIVLGELVAGYLGPLGRGNPYRIGARLSLETP